MAIVLFVRSVTSRPISSLRPRGEVRSLLDKRVGDAVEVALIGWALRVDSPNPYISTARASYSSVRPRTTASRCGRNGSFCSAILLR